MARYVPVIATAEVGTGTVSGNRFNVFKEAAAIRDSAIQQLLAYAHNREQVDSQTLLANTIATNLESTPTLGK